MTEAELEALCWAVKSRWPSLEGGALFDRAHHEIHYPLPSWAKTGHGQVPQKRLRACLDRLAQVNVLQAHLEIFLAQHTELPLGVIREVYEGLIVEPVSRNPVELRPDDDFSRLMEVSEAVFIRGESIQDNWPEAVRAAIERLRGVTGRQELFHELFFGHGVQFQPPVPYEADQSDPRVKQRVVEEA